MFVAFELPVHACKSIHPQSPIGVARVLRFWKELPYFGPLCHFRIFGKLTNLCWVSSFSTYNELHSPQPGYSTIRFLLAWTLPVQISGRFQAIVHLHLWSYHCLMSCQRHYFADSVAATCTLTCLHIIMYPHMHICIHVTYCRFSGSKPRAKCRH